MDDERSDSRPRKDPRIDLRAEPDEDDGAANAKPAPVPAEPSTATRLKRPVAAPAAPPPPQPAAAAPRAAPSAVVSRPAVAAAPAQAPAQAPIATSGELDRTKELLAAAIKANEALTASIATAQSADDAAFARMREEHQAEVARMTEEHAAAIAKLKAEHATSLAFMKSEMSFSAQTRANASAPPAKGRGLPWGRIVALGGAGVAVLALYLLRDDAKGALERLGSKPVPESADGGKGGLGATTQEALAASAEAKDLLNASATPGELKNVKSAGEELKTRTDMTSLAHVMEIDGINHDMPTPGRFGEYIRKNSLSSAGDPAIDAWGMPYRLDAPPKKLAIRSAGPDKTFETGDDIVVEVQGMTTR